MDCRVCMPPRVLKPLSSTPGIPSLYLSLPLAQVRCNGKKKIPKTIHTYSRARVDRRYLLRLQLTRRGICRVQSGMLPGGFQPYVSRPKDVPVCLTNHMRDGADM